MARKQSIEEIRVSAVDTIADVTAPTVAELDAGTLLQDAMTRDGLTTPDSGNTVDASDVSNLQNKTARGTRGGDSLSITAHRDSDSASDGAWDTLSNDYDGYIVIRRFGGSSTAWASGDVVEVWPIEVISREMAAIATDQTQRFTSQCAVTDAVTYDATVAA